MQDNLNSSVLIFALWHACIWKHKENTTYLVPGWWHCRRGIRRDLLSEGSSHGKRGKIENRSATPNEQSNGEKYQESRVAARVELVVMEGWLKQYYEHVSVLSQNWELSLSTIKLICENVSLIPWFSLSTFHNHTWVLFDSYSCDASLE